MSDLIASSPPILPSLITSVMRCIITLSQKESPNPGPHLGFHQQLSPPHPSDCALANNTNHFPNGQPPILINCAPNQPCSRGPASTSDSCVSPQLRYSGTSDSCAIHLYFTWTKSSEDPGGMTTRCFWTTSCNKPHHKYYYHPTHAP